MKFAVDVEITVEAADEDDAWNVVYALMQRQFGEHSDELPEPVEFWSMYEEVVTPLEDDSSERGPHVESRTGSHDAVPAHDAERS